MEREIKSYTNKKIADYLRDKPARVGLFFWHGLGDLLMFLRPLGKLKTQFPETQIDLICHNPLIF